MNTGLARPKGLWPSAEVGPLGCPQARSPAVHTHLLNFVLPNANGTRWSGPEVLLLFPREGTQPPQCRTARFPKRTHIHTHTASWVLCSCSRQAGHPQSLKEWILESCLPGMAAVRSQGVMPTECSVNAVPPGLSRDELALQPASP